MWPDESASQQSEPALDSEALDDLVRLYFHAKTDETWIAAETAEALALAGSIEEALSVFGPEGISALEQQQPRLHFRLKRQQFFEYLRKRTPEGLAHAIRFLREELAPLALHAYPEAYEELKKCLLALVFLGEGADAREDGISKEWLVESRQATASQLSRFYRQINGCFDSDLMLLLRYLALTFAEAHAEPGKGCPASASFALLGISPTTGLLGYATVNDATRSLVASLGVGSSGRAPPLPPPESVSLQAASAAAKVPNRLVIMMKAALGIRREAVLDSIRAADGDVAAALRHELAAIKLNRACVDKLAHEYAAARGLNLQEASTNVLLEERRGSGHIASPSTQAGTGKVNSRLSGRHASQSPPKKFARLASPAAPGKVLASDLAAIRRLRELQQTHGSAGILQQVRADVEAGELAEAIEAINGQDPGFLPAHPTLDFDLHAALFHQMLDEGATARALALARSKLSIICEQHQALQPKLKATMARLILGTAEEGRLSLSSLADMLDAKQRSWLGMQEPRLVTLLQALLRVHQRWFELQSCADPFESMLGIDVLWPTTEKLCSPVRSEVRGRYMSPSPGAAELPTGPTVAFDQVPVQLDEELISEAMDITNLSRAAVMNLLRDVGGNLEALLDNLFQ